ncbi:urease accessory protein UreD [Flavobacterium nitratireducens]|uniref:urease accessory protein UreD n=1 Tax=Flavobacterium nitratireducens TaxID=992289 RepID=UPI002415832D|nr:urease accessory protein UreD [Flavobacterium nitratireducens]
MISKVIVESEVKNGITQLKSVFFNTPFKVVDIREDKKKPLLELILMSSSPGVLDGDELYFEYILNENSQLEITTQSFQRLFTMEKGAFQETKVLIKENAFLSYLPHPSVPHKGSDFKSNNTIYLEKNASVLWGEIFTCGRKLKGEVFEFTKMQSLTKVYQEDKLVFFENLYLNPSEFNPINLGQLEGFTHQLSLFFLHQSIDVKKMKSELDLFLKDKNCVFGISEAPANGLVIKILYNKAEKLMSWMKEITKIIKQYGL